MGAFGTRGELRVDITTDEPKKRFSPAAKIKVYLKPPEPKGLLARTQRADSSQLIEVSPAGAKVRVLPRGQEAWILRFAELQDCSQAEQLMGYTLHMLRAARAPLQDPDSFWAQDLVGAHAFLKEGQYVGKVVDVLSGFGTHDTLLLELAMTPDDVRNSSTRQCMVPFAKAMVPHVDLQLAQLQLDLPEGLLDLSTRKPMRRKLTPEQTDARLAVLHSPTRPVLGQPIPADLLAALHTGGAAARDVAQTGSGRSGGAQEGLEEAGGAGDSAAASGGAAEIGQGAGRAVSRGWTRLPTSAGGGVELPAQREAPPTPGRGTGTASSGRSHTQAQEPRPASAHLRRGRSASSGSVARGSAHAAEEHGEEEEMHEHGGEADEWDESEQTGSTAGGGSTEAVSSERWKLRRQLGASLAAKQRQLRAVRRTAPRKPPGDAGDAAEGR